MSSWLFRPIRLLGLAGLLASACFAQQQALVKHNVNLRSDPSTDNPPIELLSPGTTVDLLEPDRTSGYYHVHTSDGKEGWVWSHNVTVQVSTAGGTPSNTPETAISSDWEKPAPVSSTFEGDEGSCGQTGDGGDSDTNLRKNRSDVPSTYHLVTWGALNNLPYPQAPRSRMQWTADQLAQITPYEGVPVSIVGYLYKVKVESGGSGESTNCHFTQSKDVDWHMYFVKQAGDGEDKAIIAETTPRLRQQHTNWTTHRLAPWSGHNLPVRLSGWVMLDPEHPDAVGQYRGTIWEIHPVTKIEVQQNGQWVDLDDLP